MNIVKTSKILAFQLAAILASAVALAEESPEARGLSIANEIDLRDTGFADTRVDMKMLLKNRHGETSTREMSMKTLEVNGDGDKTLIYFDQPRDVKGTAFLSFTHKEGQDDQWLYLPALARVKRIASNNKSGPFVGSEFAYEDLSSQEVEKYTYQFIEEVDVAGGASFIVERYPIDRNSGYTRQVMTVDQSRFIVTKIDFYDRKNSLLKTLDFLGFQQYLEKYWRADRMLMTNHQTGKTTELVWTGYEFSNGYSERDFDQRSLRNTR